MDSISTEISALPAQVSHLLGLTVLMLQQRYNAQMVIISVEETA